MKTKMGKNQVLSNLASLLQGVNLDPLKPSKIPTSSIWQKIGGETKSSNSDRKIAKEGGRDTEKRAWDRTDNTASTETKLWHNNKIRYLKKKTNFHLQNSSQQQLIWTQNHFFSRKIINYDRFNNLKYMSYNVLIQNQTTKRHPRTKPTT